MRQNLKISRSTLLKFAVVIPVLLLATVFNHNRDDSVDKAYKERFDFFYSGIITEVNNDLGTHVCMLKIALDTTSIKYFDIRDSTAFYHEVIQENQAEVIEQIIYLSERKNLFSPGMRYTFNGAIDSAYLQCGDIILESIPLHISTFDLVTIAKYHKLPLQEGKKAVMR